MSCPEAKLANAYPVVIAIKRIPRASAGTPKVDRMVGQATPKKPIGTPRIKKLAKAIESVTALCLRLSMKLPFKRGIPNEISWFQAVRHLRKLLETPYYIVVLEFVHNKHREPRQLA